MMILKFKKTEEKEIEVELILPVFYKFDQFEMLAIFDEKNFVSVFQTPNMKRINSFDLSLFYDHSKLKDEIMITEKEFMEFYNSVHEFLSLKPELHDA